MCTHIPECKDRLEHINKLVRMLYLAKSFNDYESVDAIAFTLRYEREQLKKEQNGVVYPRATNALKG